MGWNTMMYFFDLPVCMNALILTTIRARDTKFGMQFIVNST